MGHEYVEIKNTSAAIQAYRQAIGEIPILKYSISSSPVICKWSKCNELTTTTSEEWGGQF